VNPQFRAGQPNESDKMKDGKMKRFKLAVVMTTAGMLAVAANAQFLEFRLTAYQQGLLEEEVKPDVYRCTIDKVRITTKDVLDLIGSYYETNFPAGARLYEPDEGDTQVLDTNGVVLLEIGSDVFELQGSDGVYAGVDNHKTNGVFSFKALTNVRMRLAVSESNHFEIAGLTTVHQSASYRKGTFKFSANMKAAGDGYLGGEHSVISGRVTGKDSGVLEDELAATGSDSFSVGCSGSIGSGSEMATGLIDVVRLARGDVVIPAPLAAQAE
jgi:hypothetical protein